MRLTRPRALTVAVATTAALVALAPSSAAHPAARSAAPASAAAPALASYSFSSADTRMRSALTSRATTARFGSRFSGAVIDVASNRVVWRKNGTTALMPASTTKLVTAHNALTTFGPSARWATRVRTTSTVSHVVVQGTGDPSLSSAQLDAMAVTTAAWLKARKVTSARVWVDDDVFPTPTLATGWKSSYVPNSITPVRGLVRDQRDVSDTSVDVGRYFRDRLKAHGIRTVYFAGRQNASGSSTVITQTRGQTLAQIVDRMLLSSDNEVAEALHKLVSYRKGLGTSWSGARTAQRRVLNSEGLSLTALYDGSGLSRSDRMTALQLAAIVDEAQDAAGRPELQPLRSSAAMPTAGRTGTLAAKYSRFTTSPSKCAAGKVWAKTGTLSDVVSLAGYTVGKDGRTKAFAFVVNGKSSTTQLKKDVDMLAATVSGCY